MIILTYDDLEFISKESFILPARFPRNNSANEVLMQTVAGLIAIILESRDVPISDEITRTKFVGELLLQNKYHFMTGMPNSDSYLETIAAEWCRMFDCVIKILDEKHEQT